MSLLRKWLAVSLVLAVAPQLIDGIVIDGFGAAAKAALLYGLLYVLVGWLLSGLFFVLSLVPGVLTLGLFFLVVPVLVHTVLLKWTADLMDSFAIHSWWSAFLLSVVLGVVNFLFDGRRKRARED